jgi:hypothetical protein
MCFQDIALTSFAEPGIFSGMDDDVVLRYE